jgi:lysophospholipase L1-like esterase
MSMSKWKLIGINLLVFFVLFNIAYWSLPTLRFLRTPSESFAATEDPRSLLPNYASLTWATQHYREFKRLETSYKSFIGWRRKPFSGETINIIGRYGQRRTINVATDKSKKIYFFGGSTMWGTGVRDDGTIPSQFAAATGLWSENFGESGYTAHQSLVLLVQLLQDGHRPDVVVFYDGANEVSIKCRIELTPDSDGLEANINRLLDNPSPPPITFAHYFAPLRDAAARMKAKLIRVVAPAVPEGFACDSNPEKATRIAENLVGDWQMAKLLVESYGGRFVGVLQPVSYFSQTRLDHLADDDDLVMRSQFRAVYPLVERRMAEDNRFHSMVHALDVDEYVYVDFCHLSPKGNGSIATGIAKFIEP